MPPAALQGCFCVWQGDYGQYEPVSGSLQLVPRARGERRPSVPLRLYVMLAHGGADSSLLRDSAATAPCPPGVEMVAEHASTWAAATCAACPSNDEDTLVLDRSDASS